MQQHTAPPAPATSDNIPISESPTSSTSSVPAMDIQAHTAGSSVPLDGGCMKFDRLGTANYVGSPHWAAVLDSITELKEHFEREEELCHMPTDFTPPDPGHSSWPQLLYGYGYQWATKAEILASIPPRRAADRLVSRYFALDISPGESTTSQREYDQFWKDPSAAPIMWVGLLFTVMCLGELHQHAPAAMDSTPGMSTLSVDTFRERIVQCLMMGKYSKGGPYVLESLIQHYMIEHYLRQDAEFEIWILLGMLIPISLRMGLHRDPKHFTEISAFAGEMRRRVWATIFQYDVGFSALAGLPRVIKPHQCDTEEPRNLLDSDFDENTRELPPSRPESEATPVLFLLAKNRTISVGGVISDLAHDTRPYPYAELSRVEKLLQDTRNSLPASLRWQPLSQSIIQGPQAILQRVYLDIFSHRMQIILYKKYLLASMTQSQYHHAREVCLDSAMRILEHQHLLDEETELDGRLSSVRWTYSSIINHDFMLAVSVLCFYIKRYNENNKVVDQETFQKITSLLRKSHQIWLRSSTASNEAQKAVQALSIVLGIQTQVPGEDGEITRCSHFSDGSADLFPQFSNPAASWPVYQDSTRILTQTALRL
ncbi:hypothetical protein A1O3_00780 [Capronia epimyces CBS 606.96]|uniref:Xylanolytic transcriptional activator regulatory domain-containing protein n=1 Tax=Capronia epimyces CBS 606.96 TaxID=1182542 RepID=W9YRD0_9EURO|nr:uncharacterized protein A1O3_00780 [Capronia epimyces CBS 606.96]EXJ92230.1 hypothetical protein A1O3_00780 [Capronia epimyces CBS 606.96]